MSGFFIILALAFHAQKSWRVLRNRKFLPLILIEMSLYPSFEENILPIRDNLANNVLINDPENYDKLTGCMSWLFSDMNPQTIRTEMRDSENKNQYRPVEIKYTPHWGDEDAGDSFDSLTCDPVSQRRSYIQNVQPELEVFSKFTLDEDYLRQNVDDGDSPQARLERDILKCMRVAREKMNEKLVSKLALYVGSNPAASERTGTPVGPGDFSPIEMIKSDGSLSVDTFDVWKNDQEDNFMRGTPGIIGLGNARKVFDRLAVGNVNTTAGISWPEVADQFGAFMFKDQFTKDVLGNRNQVLLCYPGLLQFFNYNLNKGFYAQQVTDLRIKGTLPDAVYPFEWDYILSYNDGCATGNGLQGSWTFTLYCSFDLWSVPSDAFGDVYGELNDFTGVVGYEITQAS